MMMMYNDEVDVSFKPTSMMTKPKLDKALSADIAWKFHAWAYFFVSICMLELNASTLNRRTPSL